MQERISAKEWRQLHDLDMPEIDQLKKSAQLPKPLEKDIQKATLNRLGLIKDAFFWRQNSGSLVIPGEEGKSRFFKAGIPGISDILGVYKGIFVAIEMKRPGKKPSRDQQAFLSRVRECGGIALVCDDDRQIVKQLTDAYNEIFLKMTASGVISSG